MKNLRLYRACFLLLIIPIIIGISSGTLFALTRTIELDQIEKVRLLGPNNNLVKVLLVLNSSQNLDFVVGLVKIIDKIHRTDKLSGKDAFKLHIVPSSLDQKNDCKALRDKVSATLIQKYVEFNKGFATSDIWMQDWGEIGMFKIKGQPKPQLAIIDSNRGRGIGELPKLLSHFWSSYYIKNPANRLSAGDYGGNIEITPDDVLIIGDTSSTELRNLLGKLGYKSRMVVVETDWLNVGHCDEYLSVAPNKTSPNGYSIIKADTRLALRLLLDTPEEDLKKIPVPEYRKKMLEIHAFLQKNRALLQPQRSVSTTEDFSTVKINLRKAEIPSANEINFALVLGDKDKNDPIKAFIETNLALDTIINSNIEQVIKTINKVNGERGKKLSVISYPNLYHKIGSGNKHIAYHPGVVNQLILRGHLIIPDPMITSFKNYITKVTKKVGLTPHFLNDMMYHELQGEIHCGTNVFRHPNRYFVKSKNLPQIWRDWEK